MRPPLNFTRLRAIAKKEILHIVRDPLSLALGFMMPALLLFIFGYAITLDVNNIRTVVCDRDRSSHSRELLSDLSASGYFRVIASVDDYHAIDRFLEAGDALIAVVIPDDFSRSLEMRKPAQLQVIVDGSDSNTATIALGYFAALAEIQAQRLGGAAMKPLVELRHRVWFNPELKSRNFIIPGLIAVIMMVIAALLTSLTIAREWERGTMEQLIATPVSTPELILGKLIPYFMIGFLDMALTLVMAVVLFDVPFQGSLALLAVVCGIFLFGSLSFGIVISIITKSQLVASQISVVATYLPAFLLSGFMFSISNMTDFLQLLTRVVPARYFVKILKGLFLKGSVIGVLITDTMFLIAFGAIVFMIANIKFEKRIG